MKRIILLILLAVTLVFSTSCGLLNSLGFGTSDSRKPSEIVRDLEAKKADDYLEEKDNPKTESEDKGKEDEGQADDQDKLALSGQLRYGFLDKDAIKAGQVKGLNLEMGMSMAAVNEMYGQPVESEYFQGGKFNKYELDDYNIFVFDADLEEVNNVMLAPKFDFKLSMVRDLLSDADYEGLGDEDGEWMILYYYGKHSLYVHGTDDNAEGSVSYFLIKQEY